MQSRAELGQIAQELIGKDANVGPDLGEKIRQHDSIQNSEGVVGNGDDGAGGWNLSEIPGAHMDLHLQIFKERADEALAARTGIKTFELINAKQPVHYCRERTRQAIGRERFECHSPT